MGPNVAPSCSSEGAGALCPSCRRREQRPARWSWAGSSMSSVASLRRGGWRHECPCSISEPDAGPSSPVPVPASTLRSPRLAGWCTPLPVARPGRTSPPSRPTSRRGERGGRSPRSRLRAAARAQPSSTDDSSRSEERSRRARSVPYMPGRSCPSAGRAWPTCARRGTGSLWSHSETGSTRSPAGRSRACTSVRRTSF